MAYEVFKGNAKVGPIGVIAATGTRKAAASLGALQTAAKNAMGLAGAELQKQAVEQGTEAGNEMVVINSETGLPDEAMELPEGDSTYMRSVRSAMKRRVVSSLKSSIHGFATQEAQKAQWTPGVDGATVRNTDPAGTFNRSFGIYVDTALKRIPDEARAEVGLYAEQLRTMHATGLADAQMKRVHAESIKVTTVNLDTNLSDIYNMARTTGLDNFTGAVAITNVKGEINAARDYLDPAVIARYEHEVAKAQVEGAILPRAEKALAEKKTFVAFKADLQEFIDNPDGPIAKKLSPVEREKIAKMAEARFRGAKADIMADFRASEFEVGRKLPAIQAKIQTAMMDGAFDKMTNDQLRVYLEGAFNGIDLTRSPSGAQAFSVLLGATHAEAERARGEAHTNLVTGITEQYRLTGRWGPVQKEIDAGVIAGAERLALISEHIRNADALEVQARSNARQDAAAADKVRHDQWLGILRKFRETGDYSLIEDGVRKGIINQDNLTQAHGENLSRSRNAHAATIAHIETMEAAKAKAEKARLEARGEEAIREYAIDGDFLKIRESFERGEISETKYTALFSGKWDAIRKGIVKQGESEDTAAIDFYQERIMNGDFTKEMLAVKLAAEGTDGAFFRKNMAEFTSMFSAYDKLLEQSLGGKPADIAAVVAAMDGTSVKTPTTKQADAFTKYATKRLGENWDIQTPEGFARHASMAVRHKMATSDMQGLLEVAATKGDYELAQQAVALWRQTDNVADLHGKLATGQVAAFLDRMMYDPPTEGGWTAWIKETVPNLEGKAFMEAAEKYIRENPEQIEEHAAAALDALESETWMFGKTYNRIAPWVNGPAGSELIPRDHVDSFEDSLLPKTISGFILIRMIFGKDTVGPMGIAARQDFDRRFKVRMARAMQNLPTARAAELATKQALKDMGQSWSFTRYGAPDPNGDDETTMARHPLEKEYRDLDTELLMISLLAVNLGHDRKDGLPMPADMPQVAPVTWAREVGQIGLPWFMEGMHDKSVMEDRRPTAVFAGRDGKTATYYLNVFNPDALETGEDVYRSNQGNPVSVDAEVMEYYNQLKVALTPSSGTYIGAPAVDWFWRKQRAADMKAFGSGRPPAPYVPKSPVEGKAR